MLRSRLRPAARKLGRTAIVGCGVIAVALAASIAPRIGNPATDARAGGPDRGGRSRLEVSLGAGSADAVERSVPGVRVENRKPRRRPTPRRFRRRVPVAAPRTSMDVASTSAPADADPAPRARRNKARTKSAPAPVRPAPPQTPLFDCLSTEGHEHFFTIDRARAGEMSSPRSGWRCSVIGQVFAFEGEGRVPIELDDGTAYVFEKKPVTEPRSELFALYRHWAGYDYYYSHQVADGGLVGYIAR